MRNIYFQNQIRKLVYLETRKNSNKVLLFLRKKIPTYQQKIYVFYILKTEFSCRKKLGILKDYISYIIIKFSFKEKKVVFGLPKIFPTYEQKIYLSFLIFKQEKCYVKIN